MPGVTLSHASGSVSFRSGPTRPPCSLDVIQPQRQTTGGVRYGFAHTIINDALALKLRATTAEKDRFVIFFKTVAKGMVEVISYTDPRGTVTTGRFAQPAYETIEKAYDAWEISIAFRAFGGGWLWPSGDVMLWPSGDTIGV